MPGFWRKCRIAFRCVRIALWTVVLMALCAFTWFNLVGLPGFLKTRLVATLHERGVNLEFSRLRLRLVRGLVCDAVRIGGTNLAESPALTASEVQIRLNLPALLHGRAEITGLVLRDGKFTLPFSPTNALALTNLQTEVRFGRDDTWTLDHFRAGFAGVNLSLSGTVAHAAELQNCRLFAGESSRAHDPLAVSLQAFAAGLEKIHFAGEPHLNAALTGDARDVHSLTFRLDADAPAVRTPWFAAHDLLLAATLTAPAEAPTNFDARWDFWTNAQPFHLAWSASAAELRLEKITVETVVCAGNWRAPELSLSVLSARLGHGKIFTGAQLDVATRVVHFTNHAAFNPQALAALLPVPARKQLAQIAWTQPPELHADGVFTLPAWPEPFAGWPEKIAPTVCLRGELAITNAMVTGQPLDFAHTHFASSNQVWQLPDLELAQGKTRLALSAAADAVSKNFSGHGTSRLDAATVQPFLPTASAIPVTFSQPLALEFSVAGNFHDLHQLTLTGGAALTNFAVRGQTVDFARSRFAFSNHVWHLPDLELAQGRTRLQLNGAADAAANTFSASIAGKFDAASVRPFLATPSAARGFACLTFHEPLALALAVRGNFRDWSQLAAAGNLALTNFAIRQQSVDWLTTDVTFTNLTADFWHPQLARAGGAQTFAAEKLTLDFAAQKLFFTGGEGNVEPAVVSRAIGPKTAKAMEPYQFLAIPRARVNGVVPLRHDAEGELIADEADLRFELAGTAPFRWRKFETPAITGLIWWHGYDLILTNAVTELYGGEGRGWGKFDLHTPGAGTDFQFFLAGTNVDLHRMGAALWSPTNALEGALSGTVAVTSANSDDWRTWNGGGEVQLRDGLLWNVPIFGLLSPVLNTVTPGLGNNRAKEAAGRFTMTNGVIHTRSLEIQTALMRLEYVGTVDLAENVNARVTAHLMRNVPVVGSVVSLLFLPVSKAFECEVTGTLGEPKATPVYLPFPKLLLAPLHPISSVRNIFTPAPTNAAPAIK